MKTLTLKTHRNDKIQAILLQRFIDNNPLVDIQFEAEFESDISPEDSFEFKKDIDMVNREIDRGNLWAWFSAKVTVKYKGFEGVDYLGGCSYRSEKQFKEHSGYYIDMISQCVDQINKEITAHNNAVCVAFKTRNLKRLADSLGFIVIPKTAIV